MLILAMPLLIAADGDQRKGQIADVAVAYAQGFDGLLRADPAEGERLGVSADDLRALQPMAVLPLFTLDAQFRQADDGRAIDAATTPTDLWWVMLGIDSNPKVVVTVQWPTGVDRPEAVGLNWAPASVLSTAFEAVTDPHARIVYLPEDAPVVVGSANGVVVAMPIANEMLTAGLELPDHPQPVAEYTVALRSRLSRLGATSDVPGQDDPGVAGGGPVAALPSDTVGGPPAAALLGPLVVVAFMALLALSLRPRLHGRDRSGA